MENRGLLTLILIVLFSAVLVVPLFKRAGLGAVLAYLILGAILGPQGFGLLYDTHGVMHLAELGVVFLMFVIGLELKPSRLWTLRSTIVGYGVGQMVLCSALLVFAAHQLGLSWTEAVVGGIALSLSSTALSLQVLAERNQLTTSFGRVAFAILLFQDLAAIPLLSTLSILSPDNHSTALNWSQVVVPAGVLILATLGGRYLLRPWFRFAASARAREVFTAAGLIVVLGAAVLMDRIGLSTALGTFLAGILLSDSEYRHELESDLEPFKGLLLGLFFMAVGMSMDIQAVLLRPTQILSITFGWMAIKFLSVLLVGRLGKQPWGNAGSLGQVLCVGGEFAFVVFGAAERLSVLTPQVAETLTLSVALSMMLSPLLYFIKDRVFTLVEKRAKPFDSLPTEQPQVILAGYGRVGQIVGRILRVHEIPHTALELDPEQVDLIRRFGTEIYYGDASRIDLLEMAGAEKAKLFVLAVDDVESSLRVAKMVREKFPGLKILARARNRSHALELYNMGITDVFRETWGSSLEMAETTLVSLGFDKNRASDVIRKFRAHDEKGLETQRMHLGDEKKLISIAKQSSQQLAQLLRTDSSGPNSQ